MAHPDDDSQQNSIREELAAIRQKQATQDTELKWTKWLAAGALGASTLGQVTTLAPPTALIDLIGRLF